jgi:UDP-glucuronate 4-epimerase
MAFQEFFAPAGSHLICLSIQFFLFFNFMDKTILVTGAAGFIGFYLSRKLLNLGYKVVGVDNINNYYEVSLKEARLYQLKRHENFKFYQVDICFRTELEKIFSQHQFAIVINLAAQAGVKYAKENPYAYVDSNILGFTNILENCRHNKVEHLVFASSSSVYGANTNMPFSVHDNVDHPISFYAATKKANELMAHSYSHLYGLPTTGLRFFTVYGPWGRPDMALSLFAKAIFDDRPINVFNNGKIRRDFTYIDDIVEGIFRVMENKATSNPDWSGINPDPATSRAPYKIYNVGNNQPVELLYCIELLEKNIGKTATKNFLPPQDDDVPETHANVDALIRDIGFKTTISIEVGIKKFIEWYRRYYKV